MGTTLIEMLHVDRHRLTDKAKLIRTLHSKTTEVANKK